MKAAYYKKEADFIRCRLCPNNCRIKPGRSGSCQVRLNRDNDLFLPYYGAISSLAVDPMEKKPLYHFYPGRSILSVGFLGCSFHCPFCQNYSISQSVYRNSRTLSPQQLVETALKENSLGIAYTYNEPSIHFEYILECARLARKKGLKNVLVTNGYLNPEPARELYAYIDAANIDLKSFNPDFYRKEIGGKLDAVLEVIKIAASQSHVELTTLIIPTKNDSEQEILQIARFIASVDKNIPFHLSSYYPTYKYSIPPTPKEALIRLSQLARKTLPYVYVGNIWGVDNNSYCPECGALLVERTGYKTVLRGIEQGKCRKCGYNSGISGS